MTSLGCSGSESTQQNGGRGEVPATGNERVKDIHTSENDSNIVYKQLKQCLEEIKMDSTISSQKKEAIQKKIADDLLKSSAMDKADKTVSVIVELELPERKIEFETSNYGDKKILKPRSVSTPDEETEAEVEKTVSEARQYLSKMLGHDPTYLRSASAFAVELSGSQVCSVAEQDFTKKVESNRRRKMK